MRKILAKVACSPSTDGQTLDSQIAALKVAGAARIYRETASGAKAERKELARAMKSIMAGDTLLVTRLDWLARSTRDLLIFSTLSPKLGRGSVRWPTFGPTRPRRMAD
jgi:DNA invertase Pin-like site-specific DNA recombinase